jgi:hypothetical protein
MTSLRPRFAHPAHHIQLPGPWRTTRVSKVAKKRPRCNWPVARSPVSARSASTRARESRSMIERSLRRLERSAAELVDEWCACEKSGGVSWAAIGSTPRLRSRLRERDSTRIGGTPFRAGCLRLFQHPSCALGTASPELLTVEVGSPQRPVVRRPGRPPEHIGDVLIEEVNAIGTSPRRSCVDRGPHLTGRRCP